MYIDADTIEKKLGIMINVLDEKRFHKSLLNMDYVAIYHRRQHYYIIPIEEQFPEYFKVATYH